MKWDQMRDEVNAHIEEKAQELIEAGVDEREAWARARREFGNATHAVEKSREVWVWTWLEHLGQDLKYAFRAMAANPLFTVLAVVSLALGIGANTSIFSFMDAILLRSLPVKDPESLVVLKFQRPGVSKGSTSGDGQKGNMSVHITSGGSYDGYYSVFPYPAFELFQKRSDLFASVFGYQGQTDQRLTVNGGAMLSDCVYVSGEYFEGLGVSPSVGRLLTNYDDQPGSAPTAMLSLAFAQQRFGNVNDAIGKTVGVNGVSFTVVGVTTPGFFGVNPEWAPEVYLPLHSFLQTQPARYTEDGKLFSQTSTYWLDVMARLKHGVTREQVQAALDPGFAEYFMQYIGGAPQRARMMVMEGAGGLDSLRHRYSQPLYVLMAMVALILIIACANLANLLLARASARRREIAVRLSMGASRWRVIRQLLTESLLLSVMGGTMGLLVASWSVRTLTVLLGGGDKTFSLRAGLNWEVLSVTLVLAIATGVAFGLAPAWQSTNVDVFPALREVRSSEGSKRRWFSLGRALVVAQITISFLLLIGAGLFVRTLSKLQSLELGFDQDNLLLLSINTQQAGYEDAEAVAFHEELRQQFKAIPGVRNATLTTQGQLRGGTTQLAFTVPDSLTEKDTGSPTLPVGPDYLTTMQIPMLLGRDISVADERRNPIAVVISESFAKKHYGTENPLGRRIVMHYYGKQELEIVGVAGDARYGSLKRDPPPMVYVDYRHSANFLTSTIRVVVRTTGEPEQIAGTVREIVRKADPGVPVGTISTQRAMIENTISQEILFARLCTAFAALALLIACVGLFGTTAYNVARRTSEIGIRMALGAQRSTVLNMVLREVVILGVAGLIIGVPIALVGSKLLTSFLYGLQPNDPATIGGAIAILLAAALLAACGPARRATRVDPMTALRHE